MKFDGEVAVVTGGGGGIGSVVAQSFSREGAKVVVADLNLEAAQKVAQEISDTGGVAFAQKLNIISWQDVQALIDKAVLVFGKIDILANCVGIAIMKHLEDITEEIWDDTLDVNAKGTFFSCKAAAIQMKKQGAGGKIVNIASEAGKVGAPFYAHYCASKFAVIGITKSLALELADHKIRVNAVCPGSIDTGMLRYELQTYAELKGKTIEDIRSEWVGCPMGRIGQPIDVARVIMFLASEDSDYMTGQAINVTGGRTTF